MSAPNYDFQKLAADLLPNALGHLKAWLPSGKLVGKEYCVGSLNGEAGESLKINITTGKWKDQASGETGGRDLLALYARLNNINNGEAYRRLTGDTGRAVAGAVTRQRDKDTPPPPEEPDEWAQVTDPPEDCIRPTLPAGIAYRYQMQDGRTLGYVVRIEATATERKTFRQWTMWESGETGEIEWRAKGFQGLKPLYGQQRLAQYPGAYVIVCEGEKCADALAGVVPGTPCLAWAGGSGSVGNVDWTPLKGRNAILWPDNDEPGRKAMATAAAALAKLGCGVRIVQPPADVPDKWDAADAIANGWGADQIGELLKLATVHTTAPAPAVKLKQVDPATVAASGEKQLVARTTTKTQAARTPAGDVVQRVEVKEEYEPKPKPSKHGFNLMLGGRGEFLANLSNLLTFLENHNQWKSHIWFDTFLGRIQTDAWGALKEWDAQATRELTVWMQRVGEIKLASTERIYEAVETVAHNNPRNCLTEWLNGLTWDETSRLPMLLPTGFGTPLDAYHVQVGQCWLLSMVARAYQPGCKVDTMPILEGKQGIGKSTALRILAGDWFAEVHAEFGSTDFCLSLLGHWLHEVPEMHGFSKTDVNQIKRTLSAANDRYRAPYGRTTETHPRQSVFLGTTNDDNYHNDHTGGRRFWPVACTAISLDWLRENREQLFAEAVHAYRAGAQWWDVPAEAAAAAIAARRQVDPWEEVIAAHLDDDRTYTARQLLNVPLDVDTDKQTPQLANRVAKILRQLGWESAAIWEAGRTQTRFRRKR